MDNLTDLIRKYIGKRVEQDSKGSGHNRTEDQKEIMHLENKIREFGFDPQTIHNMIENPEPNHPNEAVDAIFKVIGEEITWKKPIRVSDQGFISKSISTRETEQGLERQVRKPLIIAACGKVIKEEEIGVKCSVCNHYDCKEHAFLCNYCSRALCIVHTYFFKNEKGENVPYCAKHYKQVVENQNTWEIKERLVNKGVKKNES